MTPGRPSQDAKTDKKQDYKVQMRLDNTDGIETPSTRSQQW